MLIENLALETKLLSIDPNPDKSEKGNKIVTLEINQNGVKKKLKLKTDSLVVASGLGEPKYTNINDSRKFKRFSDRLRLAPDEMDKALTSLEAFEALASKTNPKKIIGDTLTIYGGGNSADTLLEYLGGLFKDAKNPSIKNLKKIYVIISREELNQRPRYKQILDLLPRNGNGNLVEIISSTKVSDIAPSENLIKSTKKNSLVLIDAKDNLIINAKGKFIQTDYAISAIGFESKLDKLLEKYDQQIRTENSATKDLRSSVTLARDPNVAVGQTLSSDPSILIVGTAAAPQFNEEKLNQLPKLAREALERNGAENAVAIGFIEEDTVAAVNDYLRDLNPEKITNKTKTDQAGIFVGGVSNNPKEKQSFGAFSGIMINPQEKELKNTSLANHIPNDLDRDEALSVAETILITKLRKSMKLLSLNEKEKSANFNLEFQIKKGLDNKWLFTATSDFSKAPPIVKQKIEKILEDKDFQSYMNFAFNTGRNRSKQTEKVATINLDIKRGLVNPAESFIDIS